MTCKVTVYMIVTMKITDNWDVSSSNLIDFSEEYSASIYLLPWRQGSTLLQNVCKHLPHYKWSYPKDSNLDSVMSSISYGLLVHKTNLGCHVPTFLSNSNACYNCCLASWCPILRVKIAFNFQIINEESK